MTIEPSQRLNPLVELLDLEQIEQDIFRGQSLKTGWLRAFGGQVAAQALVAAGRTVAPDRPVHSLHSYFIRPGDSTQPIVYTVDRLRDGRAFTTRRVVGIQQGKAIFTLSASFHVHEEGLEHQARVPQDVPPPDEVPTLADRLRHADPAGAHYLEDRTDEIELRWVDDPPWELPRQGPRTGGQRVWMRAGGYVPDDPLLHICLLTYASDMTLLDSVLLRHGVMVGHEVTSMASLDHAMWFMRPVRADEWFLYATMSPFAAGGRGLATGRFFDQQGHQLASVVQEGLLRIG